MLLGLLAYLNRSRPVCKWCTTTPERGPVVRRTVESQTLTFSTAEQTGLGVRGSDAHLQTIWFHSMLLT